MSLLPQDEPPKTGANDMSQSKNIGLDDISAHSSAASLCFT
ncbi:MAG TPA: hypothetical protein V6C57_23995 [Coleofasciculaceae cyanobacterium]